MTHSPFHPVHIHVGETGTAPVLITCEHASRALPPGWTPPPEDAWIWDTHWAWDPGAADLARALADEIEAVVVEAGFSRLFLDPNRPLDSDTLFRATADGKAVVCNTDLSAEERARRIALCYAPFHEVLGRQARNRRGRFLLSIHSFTPIYEGKTRALEVGIMHVDQPEAAAAWCAHLTDRGFAAAVNQPYSGADGFMYSAHTHARSSGRDALMLEIRQDIIGPRQEDLVTAIHACMVATGVLVV